jgi:hypothetical protein
MGTQDTGNQGRTGRTGSRGGTRSTVTGRGAIPRWPFDPVRGLRRVGKARAILFPDGFRCLTVGRERTNDIVIADPSVSRLRHATIERHGDRLLVTDHDSKNGCWSEGARFGALELTPGLIVRFGEIDMFAWSMHTDVAGSGLHRFFGYGDVGLRIIDRVLHAAIRRRPLALAGGGGPGATVIARYLHYALPGHDRPIVEVDQRVPTDAAKLAVLVGAARHGTLVVPAAMLPRRAVDLKALLEKVLADEHAPRVIIIGEPDLCPLVFPVYVPPIAERRGDLPAMIDDWIGRVGAPIGASPRLVLPEDRAILEHHPWDTYDELDLAITRLVHLRRFGGAEAGRRLGVTTSTMSKWGQRMGFRAE